jgi:hypothetical protein
MTTPNRFRSSKRFRSPRCFRRSRQASNTQLTSAATRSTSTATNSSASLWTATASTRAHKHPRQRAPPQPARRPDRPQLDPLGRLAHRYHRPRPRPRNRPQHFSRISSNPASAGPLGTERPTAAPGSGLTIAKRLLEHQHATLTADNDPAGGARISLTIKRTPSLNPT